MKQYSGIYKIREYQLPNVDEAWEVNGHFSYQIKQGNSNKIVMYQWTGCQFMYNSGVYICIWNYMPHGEMKCYEDLQYVFKVIEENYGGGCCADYDAPLLEEIAKDIDDINNPVIKIARECYKIYFPELVDDD